MAELQPQRDLSRSPLFQVMLTLENASRQESTLRGLRLAGLGPTAPLAKFDLTLRLVESRDGLKGEIEYRKDLFDDTTIQRMCKHYARIVEGLVSNPGQRLSQVQMLGEVERYQLRVGWNDSGRNYERKVCLHEMIEHEVEVTPDSVAVVYEDECLSYYELNRRANSLGRHLLEQGVVCEEVIGLCVERSFEMIIGLLGILKSGGAYLPLDSSYPSERLAFILEDAGVRMIVTGGEWLGLEGASSYQRIGLDREWTGLESTENGNLGKGGSGSQLAYVIYTSGSTGRPKGVLIEHRQVMNYYNAIRERLDLPRETSVAMVQPLTVDSSVTVVYGALCGGGTLHLISPERSLDAKRLAEYFDRWPMDCLKIAPSHLSALIGQLGEVGEVLPQRGLVIGGEASHWEFVTELVRGSECRIYNHYGPTETTVGVLTYEVEISEGNQSATVPIGRPLANTEMYVIGAGGEDQAVGVAGELYIGGEGVGRGYLNRP
ncbi:MAG: non-ribosomal peptide synthetase, partial [Blastocatellia bacterium]